MKLIAINTVAGYDNAPGRIMTDICRAAADKGHDVTVVYGRGQCAASDNLKAIRFGSKIDVLHHALMSRITDSEGLHSASVTRRLTAFLEREKPDLVHLHNLHGHYLNYPILMSWLKKSGIPVVWTLHDQWLVTGHCASPAGCDRLRYQCDECLYMNRYPKSVFANNSAANYRRKQLSFSGFDNLTIVAVSQWLAGELRQSFLADNPVKVIPNGIDTEIFHPYPTSVSGSRFNILGVASHWSESKGLGVFIDLADKIGDSCDITIVGNTGSCKLPRRIRSLGHISSSNELARIYSLADIYINPSQSETFGMTTIEAMACGTPVIVNNCTALPECVVSTVGKTVNINNIDSVIKVIDEFRKAGKADYTDNCVSHIRAGYTTRRMTDAYLSLYNEILSMDD